MIDTFNTITKETTMRIQIPAYTDHWMKGDRYGEVVKTTRDRRYGEYDHRSEVAHVKLDKSGKTVRVVLNDCTVVEP